MYPLTYLSVALLLITVPLNMYKFALTATAEDRKLADVIQSMFDALVIEIDPKGFIFNRMFAKKAISLERRNAIEIYHQDKNKFDNCLIK